MVVQKLLCRVSLAYTIYTNHPPTLSCPSHFFLSIFLPRSPRHTVSPNELCYMNGIRSRNLTRLCISLSTNGEEEEESWLSSRGVLGFHGYNDQSAITFLSLARTFALHPFNSAVLLRAYTAGEKCFTVSMDAWYIHSSRSREGNSRIGLYVTLGIFCFSFASPLKFNSHCYLFSDRIVSSLYRAT